MGGGKMRPGVYYLHRGSSVIGWFVFVSRIIPKKARSESRILPHCLMGG